MSLLELIKTGGWTMYPLLACSIVIWAVVVERFLALKKWKEKNEGFLLAFSNAWIKQDFAEAKALTTHSSLDLAQLAKELFNGEMKIEKFTSRFERRRIEISQEMRRFLWILGTIGTASPFIGLFGTVVGIIRSFSSMAQAGGGGFSVVAAGISEALVATAAGIFVAVIAVFFYNYFLVKVGSLQFKLKVFAEELLDLWMSKQEKTGV